MTTKKLLLGLLAIIVLGCNSNKKEIDSTDSYSDIKIAGVKKNVLWKGEMGDNVKLDTISNKKGLYGLGPLSHLSGELLINNGKVIFQK